MAHRTLATCLLLALVSYVTGGALFAHQQVAHAATAHHHHHHHDHDHQPEAPQPDPSEVPCEVCDLLAGFVAISSVVTDTSTYQLPPTIVLAPAITDTGPTNKLFTRSSRGPPLVHF